MVDEPNDVPQLVKVGESMLLRNVMPLMNQVDIEAMRAVPFERAPERHELHRQNVVQGKWSELNKAMFHKHAAIGVEGVGIPTERLGAEPEGRKTLVVKCPQNVDDGPLKINIDLLEDRFTIEGEHQLDLLKYYGVPFPGHEDHNRHAIILREQMRAIKSSYHKTPDQHEITGNWSSFIYNDLGQIVGKHITNPKLQDANGGPYSEVWPKVGFKVELDPDHRTFRIKGKNALIALAQRWNVKFPGSEEYAAMKPDPVRYKGSGEEAQPWEEGNMITYSEPPRRGDIGRKA